MIEVLKQGWGELEGLPRDPSAEEAFGFVEKLSRLQSVFKPGWLNVRDCEVVPLEDGVEEWHGILQARQLSVSGRVSPVEAVIVRATFRRAPRRSQHAKARVDCTHLSAGLVRLTDGVVKDRGRGYDITYSAFESTKGNLGIHRVRVTNFPNGWRRTLRYAVLAKLLEWQLEKNRLELSACQGDLERANQALTHREESNS